MLVDPVRGACRVFVCDNWAFSGLRGAVFLKRKHTARLNLRAVVPAAVDQFLERAGAFRLDIDRMKDFALRDGRAKAIIHDASRPGVMPLRLFPVVSQLYFDDESQFEKFPERILWSLNNAVDRGREAPEAGPAAGRGLGVGRMFGRMVHRAKPSRSP